MQDLSGLRVLYISGIAPGYYGEFRLWALRRLGLEAVVPLDYLEYTAAPGMWGKVQHRTQVGAGIRRLNRAILERAKAERVHAALCDKVLGLWPETLRALRQMGVLTVDYVNDNPFGPRRDPGWRLFRKALPEYDLHAVPRRSSMQDFLRQGARAVTRINFTFEPSVHFPPPAEWSDRDRDRNVSFVGTPYDQRGAFLTGLWRAGLPVDISGSRPHWKAALTPAAFAGMFRVGELKVEAYREAIWRSRINLAFVTHGNVDDVAHKAFEITACGGFLLAERTPAHLACFREDEEAVFFADEAECVEKIRRYLPDEAARSRIAAAGQRRAAASGYDNDSMLGGLLSETAEMLRERGSRTPALDGGG
jgi:spore maturation protein CgeB